MTLVESVLLSVKLRVEISILLLSVDQKVLLIVDLLAKSVNGVNVNLHTASVVILHPALIIGGSIKRLFKVEKLVLQILVLTLASPHVHRLLT